MNSPIRIFRTLCAFAIGFCGRSFDYVANGEPFTYPKFFAAVLYGLAATGLFHLDPNTDTTHENRS